MHSSHAVRYFPPWLPGGGWKKQIPEYTKDLNAMCDIPYQFVKDCMVGLRTPSSDVPSDLLMRTILVGRGSIHSQLHVSPPRREANG